MKPYYESDDGAVTLYHGDCLEVLPTLAGFDAVITDPPYNVGKDYGAHNDAMSDEEYATWSGVRVAACLALCDNQFWVAPRYQLGLWLSLLPGAHLIVIRRGAAGPYRQGWSDQFQIALAVGKPSRCVSDLWSDIRLKGEGYFFREETYEHPGYTPYPLMARAVELFSTQSVCDPFMGTGGTGIACVKSGRSFTGIELDERWIEIAAKRIIEAKKQGMLDLEGTS
jgi:site-specific DNA-methyltransferase (adenine-specific)